MRRVCAINNGISWRNWLIILKCGCKGTGIGELAWRSLAVNGMWSVGDFYWLGQCHYFPSVHYQCWLGDRSIIDSINCYPKVFSSDEEPLNWYSSYSSGKWLLKQCNVLSEFLLTPRCGVPAWTVCTCLHTLMFLCSSEFGNIDFVDCFILIFYFWRIFYIQQKSEKNQKLEMYFKFGNVTSHNSNWTEMSYVMCW